MLNVALFPFKDLSFYDSNNIIRAAEEINNSASSKKEQQQLIGMVHRNILLKCHPNSLDEINLVLEKYYPFFFKKIMNSNDIERELYVHYFSIIENFSNSLLSHRDGEIVYKYWKNSKDDEFLGPYKELDKVHIFNTISRFIPIDILVAAYYSINKINETLQLNGFYQHINLADAPLHDILIGGVSENHIHASSAFNFTTLWYLAMNNRIKEEYFNNFKTNQFAISDKVKEYMLTAQILRIILSKFLHDNPNLDIYHWLNNEISDKEYKNYIINDILNFGEYQFLDTSKLKMIIDELKKDFGVDDGDRENDIIFSIFKDDADIKTYGENILLNYAFKYKSAYEHQNKNFIEFCSVFFKYIAIKNEFYQQVTQPSAIKGLDFFKPYFDRATDGFDKKGSNYYTYMLRTLFQNKYLKKVELRLSILEKEGKNISNIKNILTAYKTILEEDYEIKSNPNADFPRIGIIYHLIKQSDNLEKCWCIYDENSKTLKDKLYYKKIQNKYFDLVGTMLRLRNRVPYLANFIVGIDAASLENNTPVQVFAPVFERARNSDCDSILIKDKNGVLIQNQSLFFTFHAGEDFRHINSGLRRIDEVIDYCKFHSGDRIGHGIALGINVEEWTKRNPVVIIPRGEYLDNLLWVWGVYSKVSNISSKAYIYLEQKIYIIAKDIFQITNGLTVPTLYDAYTKRFDVLQVNDDFKEKDSNKDIDKTKECVYKFCPQASDRYGFYWDNEKLQHAYHCKCYLEKLTEPIYINTSDIEKEISTEMQKYLINKVAMHGIVVEVNPTSNFAIGEINSVYNNQFFNINSPSDRDFKSVSININSDNPMVFNTNVSNEIAYLYYGMLERGYSREFALMWIEKIRKSGMDTSFIRCNVSNYQYINSLYSLIDALNDPMYC